MASGWTDTRESHWSFQMNLYRREGQTAERPHLNLPEGTYEEEIGLEGFYGPVAHLFHRNAPTTWSNLERASFQWPAKSQADEDFLKPHCFRSVEKVTGDFFQSGRLYFFNDDTAIWVHSMTEAMSVYFRNSDASEICFCHQGSATLETPFGNLEAKRGDYIMIPKGVTYRWKTKGAYLLRIENLTGVYKFPERGILGQQALYHEEGIRSPLFSHKNSSLEKESRVRVQNNFVLTDISYPYDVRDVAGWFGNLFPYVLSTNDIAPLVSPIAALPPSAHSTFMGGNFVVCTFLPRPLEEPEGALKVPFFHSNIDYDEVIFYHDGDFFSRDNMAAGYLTLHPRGINHGPHPKALLNQSKKTRTDEVAVMCDTVRPLKVTPFARGLEIKDYWKSWMSK